MAFATERADGRAIIVHILGEFAAIFTFYWNSSASNEMMEEEERDTLFIRLDQELWRQ